MFPNLHGVVSKPHKVYASAQVRRRRFVRQVLLFPVPDRHVSSRLLWGSLPPLRVLIMSGARLLGGLWVRQLVPSLDFVILCIEYCNKPLLKCITESFESPHFFGSVAPGASEAWARQAPAGRLHASFAGARTL